AIASSQYSDFEQQDPALHRSCKSRTCVPSGIRRVQRPSRAFSAKVDSGFALRKRVKIKD
ncbi:MAG TPA: hypothetical protein PK706_24385, partial [Xanthobacteraceae bacterium]|nr:hypothetical protein [Xanthobacteraceae bacterium]